MSSYSIVEAPSNLGLKPNGVECMSQALLSSGLLDELQAQYVGKVETSPFNPQRDPITGLVNGDPIRGYSNDLASVLMPLMERMRFPIVLGGDCSILLGPMLALRRLGSYGLFFLDGHADFYQPEAEPSGEVASMELALISGRGPLKLADIDGLGPLAEDKNIVAFGSRDEELARREGSQDIEATPIWAYSLKRVRSMGVGPATDEAVAKLVRRDLNGFWIHLDADVLDDEDMPAVDYRQPGGLSFFELSDVLRRLLATGRAVGLTVTIFNPKLDREGKIARKFVNCIAMGLSGREPTRWPSSVFSSH